MRVYGWLEEHRKVSALTTLALSLCLISLSLSLSLVPQQGATHLDFPHLRPQNTHTKPNSVETYLHKSLSISGEISRSFYLDARAKNVPHSIISEITDRLASRLDFNREIHRGDQFNIQLSGDSTAVLLTFSLRGRNRNIGLYRTVSNDERTRYLDQTGRALDDTFLRYPLNFSGITSGFSLARLNPVTKKIQPHYGIDFKAAIGTAVRAIGDGIIVNSGVKGGAGLMIRIKHASGYQSSYLHLSKIAPGIRPGQRVVKGEYIGAVGNSGHATGPHLHFALSRNGRFLNPINYSS